MILDILVVCLLVALFVTAAHVRTKFHAAAHKHNGHPWCNEARD